MPAKTKQVENVYKIGDVVLNEKILDQIKCFTEEDNYVLKMTIEGLQNTVVFIGNQLSQVEGEERDNAIGLLESTCIGISYLRNLEL